MTRRSRHILATISVAVVATATGLVAIHFAGAPAAPAPAVGEGELPTALARHLDRLKALPGNQGMSLEGPGSAADAAYLARAFPADAIAVGHVQAAKAAFSASKGKPFPHGKGQKGTWISVGPSSALYPSSEFLNSFLYVPNAYIAGGRTTAIAIADNCSNSQCRAWISTAGGGIWRTDKAFSNNPKWDYLGGPLEINSTGAIAIDKNDPTGNTIYAGTGEANICGSGCVAGVGLYKSTNGGDTWTGPLGQAELGGKGIGEIVIKPGDPNTLYVATTTALTGMSSVCCTGVTRPTPGAAKWGLYKSTNGGATWAFIHNGSTNAASCTGDLAEFNNTPLPPPSPPFTFTGCSPRGVRNVALDPTNANIVYASSFARGVWRSPDGGATWTQIKPSINAAVIQSRPNLSVTTLPNGKTRMYVFEGNAGQNPARLFRSDDVATGAPAFADLTSSNPADSGWAWFGMCDPQCWYDSFVHTPAGHPDIVYVGGDYSYGETIANKRGVVMSTDAGVSGTDMTFDGTDALHPNGLHPDQHDIATHPNNPFLFIEVNDGGAMRSSGSFVNRSAWCSDPNRGLSGVLLARCQQMLSSIPSELTGINKGLSTLQFMSLSVSPHNSNLLQGGTQDNGTWQTNGNPNVWENMMIGDGGQSGFDVANPNFRFHTFTGPSVDVNFNNGNIADWIWTGDPMFGGANGVSEFYSPAISDPVVSGTMFAGTGSTAYRTKTFGLGNRTIAEANAICNEWTGTFAQICGDWARLGPTPLVAVALGDRDGGAVGAIERTTADSSTAWAATTRGRVFISKNVDADPAVSVSWTRLDDDSAIDPNRFVSSIYVDPANGNHAWISYSGYGVNTPGTPGHIFEVTYDPVTGTSTWVDRSLDIGDQPVTDLVLDEVTGDLYAATDYGVLRLAGGTTTWTSAAPGMPNVEVTGLTILGNERILYAATHGLSAWRLNLN